MMNRLAYTKNMDNSLNQSSQINAPGCLPIIVFPRYQMYQVQDVEKILKWITQDALQV